MVNEENSVTEYCANEELYNAQLIQCSSNQLC